MEIDNLKHESAYRSMGGGNDRMGAGLMRKFGRKADFENSIPPYFVVVYVLQGEGEYLDFSGRRHPLEAGSFFYRMPGIIQSNYIEPESRWTECFIEFGKGIFAPLRALGIIKEERPVGNIGLSISIRDEIIGLISQLRKADEEELPAIFMKSLSILSEFTRDTGTDSIRSSDAEIIRKSCRYLGSEFREKLNIVEFCLKNGWGYEKFRKLFQSQIGISPGKYRVRRRIDTACQMLKNPNYKINEIASELGYSSPYEFSAQFKKFTGIYPSAFRIGKNDK